MIIEFKPPQRVNTSLVKSTKIFLAGTIEMGESEDWQYFVVNQFRFYLKNEVNVDFYNPRRAVWDNSLKQEFENPQFNQQVNWEMSNLDKADIIILNLLPDSKSPISLLELGLYAKSGKLLVVCPKEFYRSGNVHIVCDKYNIPLYENINQLLEDLITKLNR